MHLVALVDSPNHVCCRYRLSAFQSYLAQAGHTLELRAWPVNRWQPWYLGGPLWHADVVIVQRRLLPRWLLFLLRRQVRLLIFDFDDAVFLRDSYDKRGQQSRRRAARFASMVRAADVVVAGNRFLADQAVLHGARPDAVRLIPTCVDLQRYQPADHQRTRDVELVWVGSASTLQGLAIVRSLLETIGQTCPEVRLKLICDRFLEVRHLPVKQCLWSEATEAAEIAAADIGISWVPDDAWSRGKCGLKVLQYLAAGLPVIANPVGVQADLVRHGGNGFLADTAAEWCSAIRRLAAEPALRRRLGQAGRGRLEAEFSLTAGAERWLNLLNQLGQREAA